MKKLGYPHNKKVPYIIIIVTYALYVAIFALYHHSIGTGIAALATIPVIAASWYFGVPGGVLTAILSIVASTIILVTEDGSHLDLFDTLGNLIRSASLILISLVVGSLGTVTRQRQEAILKLEKYEQDVRPIQTFSNC